MFTHDHLKHTASKIAQNDGDHKTNIPGLWVYRRSAATEAMPCIYGLGLGITVQGGKRVLLGDEVFDYGVGQSLITSLDLPVVSYVSQASKAAPYIGIRLELDARTITQEAAKMDLPDPTAATTFTRAVSVNTLDSVLLDAVARLLALNDESHLIRHLAPLVQQEIVIRLLRSAHAPTLRQTLATGTRSQSLSQLMDWLKNHYTEKISIDDLAAKAHMSPSTFRENFRTITGSSPLQYLKNLRLQEARQLMLNDDMDAGSAALRVGYESASQFSREYRRLFGAPPYRDLQRMKLTEPAPA